MNKPLHSEEALFDSFSENRRRNYTEPRILKVAGIDTVVVDPHNEVFSFWHHAIKGSEKGRAVLLHVDKHSDMGSSKDVFTLEYDDVEDYAKNGLGIGSFIAPAVCYGLVGSIYWIDPEEDIRVNCYGEIKNNGQVDFPIAFPSTKGVVWRSFGELVGESRDEVFINDFIGYNGNLILDIDLDAFECSDVQFDSGKGDKRIKRLEGLLVGLPRPNLISIARSQTPYCFVPPERVDYLEASTLEMLERVYSRV
jgi:hypothetical protein